MGYLKNYGGNIMVTGIIVVNIFLAVICTVFIVKNFLVCYKGSDKGFKNIFLVAFIIVALFCALNGVWQGNVVGQYIDHLGISEGVEEKEIAMLKQMIETGKRSIIRTTIIGYLSFFISYAIYINIKKEIKTNLEKHKEKWNLNKFK